MEIYYNSKGIESFLDVNIGDVATSYKKGYDYKIKMIQENNIPCLIKPIDSEMDGTIWLRYNTNFAYVVEKLFMCVKPDGSLLKIILGQLCELLNQLDNYFLLPDELVISPEYMYYDSNEKKVKLLYIPGYNKAIKSQLKSFMEFVMKNFDHRDAEGVSLMYRIYELVVWEGFSVDSLNKCLKSDDGIDNNYIKQWGDSRQNNTVDPNLMIEKNEGIIDACNGDICIEEANIEKINSIRKCTWHEPILIINAMCILIFLVKFFTFGRKETDIIVGIVLLVVMIVHALFYVGEEEEENIDQVMEAYKGNSGQTMVEKEVKREEFRNQECKVRSLDESWLDRKEISACKLVPLSDGLSIIELNKESTQVVIGRGRKESDYRLPTTQISRVHACVQKERGEIFVEDKNSTNGTYINSNRLPANQRIRVNKGDIVSFANVEFFVS